MDALNGCYNKLALSRNKQHGLHYSIKKDLLEASSHHSNDNRSNRLFVSMKRMGQYFSLYLQRQSGRTLSDLKAKILGVWG